MANPVSWRWIEGDSCIILASSPRLWPSIWMSSPADCSGLPPPSRLPQYCHSLSAVFQCSPLISVCRSLSSIRGFCIHPPSVLTALSPPIDASPVSPPFRKGVNTILICYIGEYARLITGARVRTGDQPQLRVKEWWIYLNDTFIFGKMVNVSKT